MANPARGKPKLLLFMVVDKFEVIVMNADTIPFTYTRNCTNYYFCKRGATTCKIQKYPTYFWESLYNIFLTRQ